MRTALSAPLVLLVLFSVAFLAASSAMAESGAPPLAPDGERPVSAADPKALSACVNTLKLTLIASTNHLGAYVVSAHPALGPILRADILSSAAPVVLTRFVCVLNAPKGRSPVLISVAPQSPPLSSGPWGVARPGAQLLAR